MDIEKIQKMGLNGPKVVKKLRQNYADCNITIVDALGWLPIHATKEMEN